MLTHTPVSFTMATAMLFFLVGQLVAATQPVHQVYWKQMFVSIVSSAWDCCRLAECLLFTTRRYLCLLVWI